MVQIPKLHPDGPLARIEDRFNAFLTQPTDPQFQRLDIWAAPLERADWTRIETWVRDGRQVSNRTQLPQGVYRFTGSVRNNGDKGQVQIEFTVNGQGVSIQVEDEGLERPARTTISEGGEKRFRTNGVPCDGKGDAPVLKVFDTETRGNEDTVNGTVQCPPGQAQTRAHVVGDGPSGLTDALRAGTFGPRTEHEPLTRT